MIKYQKNAVKHSAFAVAFHSNYDVITINLCSHACKLQDTACVARQLLANFLLYLAINFAGMYTKYLTDRGQRLAFIETHKAMEHKKDSEKEYQRTQKLLDSSKLIFIFHAHSTDED